MGEVIWQNREMKAISEEKRELLISAKERGEKEDDIAIPPSIEVVSAVFKPTR